MTVGEVGRRSTNLDEKMADRGAHCFWVRSRNGTVLFDQHSLGLRPPKPRKTQNPLACQLDQMRGGVVI